MVGRLPLNLFLVICSILYLNLQQISCEEDLNDDDIPVVEGVQVTEEEDVLVLTNDNFDLIVPSKKIILVEFYAPWCGHCKTLAPEYAKAAAILKDSSPSIPLAKVDATQQEGLARKYDVTGYPTLFVFKKGNKIEYDGPRTAQGIVDYMKREADVNYTPPPSAVSTLTEDNFTTFVENDLVLVEFYAPWCGHCKRLAPEYERAAGALSNLPKPILLGKVDATLEKGLADKYSVTGYPTLFVFRKGQYNKYDGPREESGLVSYMIEQSKHPSTEIKTAKQLDNGISDKGVTIVGFFESDQSPTYQQYINAANLQRGKYNFLHTFSETVLKHASAKPGTIALYQPQMLRSKYEPVRREFNLEGSVYDEILGFFERYRLPLVGHRNNQNVLLYSKQLPLVVVYYDVNFSFEHRKQTQLVRKYILDVAKDYVGQVTFAISNEDDYQDELKELGLEDSGEDVNIGFFKSQSVRYAMEPTEDFSSSELSEFVQNVLKGKLKRHIKSTKPPKSNDGPLLTVVGSTFDDLVLLGKDKQDVLIEFYAPWCQHCQRFAPTFAKMAKDMAVSHGNDLKFAKMDATANDVPEAFKIEGYPTIYYVSHKRGDKNSPKLVKYDTKSWDASEIEKFALEQLESKTKDEL